MELTFRGVHPCPLELSSYLEASYSCLPGKSQNKRFMDSNLTDSFAFLDLQSFASSHL